MTGTNKPEPLSDYDLRALWSYPDSIHVFGRKVEAAVVARYEARIAELEKWQEMVRENSPLLRQLAELERERDALRADAKVPAGWCLVPEVPTDDMLVAGQEEWVLGRRGSATEECEEAKAIYGAMVRMAQFERQPELFGSAAQEKPDA